MHVLASHNIVPRVLMPLYQISTANLIRAPPLITMSAPWMKPA